MKISIGIDIGKKRCDYCVVDGRGNVLERGQYTNIPAGVTGFTKKMASKYKRRGNKCQAVCESTARMWVLTYDTFEAAGIRIKLANPFKIAASIRTAKKTDRIDAEKLAQALRNDTIPYCHVPNRTVRGLRNMVRRRTIIVRDRTRVMNQHRSALDAYGIRLPGVNAYSEKHLTALETTKLGSPHDEMVMRQYASQIRFFTQEIELMDVQLKKAAASNKYARLLTSMTGVGPSTALLLAVEIDEIDRFESPKQMASWAGLCPTVYQSGDKFYMGKMKKIDRNSLVTFAMCESAQSAARFDEKMKKVYEAAKKRHAGKHIPAIVVVAHKMIHIMWKILKTQTPYKSCNKDLYEWKLADLDKALE